MATTCGHLWFQCFGRGRTPRDVGRKKLCRCVQFWSSGLRAVWLSEDGFSRCLLRSGSHVCLLLWSVDVFIWISIGGLMQSIVTHLKRMLPWVFVVNLTLCACITWGYSYFKLYVTPWWWTLVAISWPQDLCMIMGIEIDNVFSKIIQSGPAAWRNTVCVYENHGAWGIHHRMDAEVRAEHLSVHVEISSSSTCRLSMHPHQRADSACNAQVQLRSPSACRVRFCHEATSICSLMVKKLLNWTLIIMMMMMMESQPAHL